MIIRNTAGQSIPAQMTNATTGADFGGEVTVYILIDGGTQTLGSVNGGIAVSEGRGVYSYNPTQAETDGSVIAYTFTGVGAITVTVPVGTITTAQGLSLTGVATGTRTGQYLLDYMEVLNQELQLQPGEANVSRGLLALNMAQDYFESLASLRPKVLGSGHGTLTTTAGEESSPFPTGLLRVDRVQVLDNGGFPVAELVPLRRVGSHAIAAAWPLNIITTTSGYPRAYEAVGGVIWWNPLPDAVYTVRWYGFAASADITASGFFGYPDVVALPLAAFATQLLKLGVDDPAQDVQSLAVATFKPVLDTLALFNRDGATSFEYTEAHSA